MRFRVNHRTRYVYADPVSLCHNIAHLKPRDLPHQRVLPAQLRIDPWPAVSSEHTDAVAFALPSFCAGRPILEATEDLMGRIYQEFDFDPHFTTIATPIADVLDHRKGVCQDFAHLGLACLRGLGLAARYVSGYLESLPPPGRPKLQGADASHAWFAVFVPGAGWVDFDPTKDQVPRQQHITTALGRDFQDVTPVRGVFYGGGEHRLEVEVDVDRVPAV